MNLNQYSCNQKICFQIQNFSFANWNWLIYFQLWGVQRATFEGIFFLRKSKQTMTNPVKAEIRVDLDSFCFVMFCFLTWATKQAIYFRQLISTSSWCFNRCWNCNFHSYTSMMNIETFINLLLFTLLDANVMCVNLDYALCVNYVTDKR